jgi:hypothetical protein
MAMGVMDVEDIELFLTNIAREIQNIAQILPKKGGMIDPHGMVQMKSIRGPHTSLLDPFFDTVLYGKRGFLIGKDNLVPSLLQALAQVDDRICRPCPFPVAKKLKDFHP